MNLVKLGRLDAGVTLATDKFGNEQVVAVGKVTFGIESDGRCTIAAEQLPLTMADTFSGKPGLSAPTLETDFAPIKPACDVLVHGLAHAPGGRPATRVPVGLKLGSIRKVFDVVGNRTWRATPLGISPGAPERFLSMAVSYDRAFGGVDDIHPDPAKHRTYHPNPIGQGYHHELRIDAVDGTPMPNTEARDAPVERPDKAYAPMSLGPVGRNWEPRYRLAGTYDKKWLDDIFPFLPPDFDDRYHQAAPPDQQMTYPHGGEVVELLNLSPNGRLRFVLPNHLMPMKLVYKDRQEDLTPVIDTVLIFPEQSLCALVWRGTRPLKGKPTNLLEVWIGNPSRARLRALLTGKEYRPNKVARL